MTCQRYWFVLSADPAFTPVDAGLSITFVTIKEFSSHEVLCNTTRSAHKTVCSRYGSNHKQLDTPKRSQSQITLLEAHFSFWGSHRFLWYQITSGGTSFPEPYEYLVPYRFDWNLFSTENCRLGTLPTVTYRSACSPLTMKPRRHGGALIWLTKITYPKSCTFEVRKWKGENREKKIDLGKNISKGNVLSKHSDWLWLIISEEPFQKRKSGESWSWRSSGTSCSSHGSIVCMPSC